jgi:hydroxyacylglutathione hydrolase
MIAASILQSHGIRNFSEIEGGFNKINETSVSKSDFICQTKTI